MIYKFAERLLGEKYLRRLARLDFDEYILTSRGNLVQLNEWLRESKYELENKL